MAGAASRQPFWRLRGAWLAAQVDGDLKKSAGYAAFAQLYRVIGDP
jgi:hypothetical protein